MNTIHHLAPLIIALVPLLWLSLVLTAPTPTQIGKSTTIVWGTAPGGTAVTPVVSNMVVTSIDIDPRNPGPIGEIENGDGALLTSIMLGDGFHATVEGVYDSALTYPALYGTVTLTLPVAVGFDSNAGTPTVYHIYVCLVESNPIKFKRKGEAMISFKVSHAPGRDGLPTA